VRHKRRARRHHVAVRPKVRSQRMRQLGAAGAVACLGALAFLTLLQLKREGVGWSVLKSKVMPRVTSVQIIGAPHALEDRLREFLVSRTADRSGSAAADLLAAFPCLKTAEVSRSYWRGRMTYAVALREALGTVTLRGRPAGYLSADGVVFEAPAGLFAVSGPELELGGAGPDDLKRLAAFLPDAVKPGGLESPLARMRFLSSTEGWEAGLADGTVLQWGDLRFTQQKLLRLREILADARAQFGGAASADLRYFEDGRVLLRPALRGVR